MAILKNVIICDKATMSQKGGGKIDIMGAFDNIINPLFPMPILSLSIVLMLEEVRQGAIVEIRVNSPSDELISKGEFELMVDPFGVGKKVVDLEKILLQERGIYTMDIIEKIDGTNKFIATTKLFIAEYPPQRPLNQDIIDKILAKDGVVKSLKTEFRPYDNQDEQVKVQISLDPNEVIEEGYIAMPKDDKVVVSGKEYDLTGIRRHVEWMFGSPMPTTQEENEKENKIEPSLNN